MFDFLSLGMKVLDRVLPDKAAREAAQLELLKLQQAGQLEEMKADLQLQLAQTDINKIEAGSTDKYTSRWRPTIGYIISAALAFQYVLNPLILWGAAFSGLNITPPNIGLDDHLWELITGMLGLAGWRTLDKINGK